MKIFVLQCEENKHSYSGDVYKFRSGEGENICWPTKSGAYLGPTGFWNCLFRAGLNPEFCDTEAFPPAANGNVLCVHSVCGLSEELLHKIRLWLEAGGFVVACGDITSYLSFLPGVQGTMTGHEYPYAGLGYQSAKGQTEILTPEKWTYAVLSSGATDKIDRLGPPLVAITGARGEPSYALVKPVSSAPSYLVKDRFIYLNADPFAAFQAWLQGQADLNPWMKWRHPFYWLDQQAEFLVRDLFSQTGLVFEKGERRLSGSSQKVVFRHDVDSSRDISFLEEVEKRGMSSVYAILDDPNVAFWTQQLKGKTNIESAFHYSTQDSSLLARVRFRLGCKDFENLKRARRMICSGGLEKQVRQAKREGIGIHTLHRHCSNFFYPEYVDSFFSLEKVFPEFLGGSSYSRTMLFRWGSLRIDGATGTTYSWPDPWFSYWYPFKLAHAGKVGKPSQGFESCSVMEFEPEHVAQLLGGGFTQAPERIVTLSYHPAHANGKTFGAKGTIGWFRDVCDYLEQNSIETITLQDLYENLR